MFGRHAPGLRLPPEAQIGLSEEVESSNRTADDPSYALRLVWKVGDWTERPSDDPRQKYLLKFAG
jgi:hypothetical protein